MPVTSNISSCAKGAEKGMPASVVKVGCFSVLSKDYEIGLMPMVQIPKENVEGIVSPFWFVRSVSEEKEANLHWQTISITVSLGTNTSDTIRVPIITNKSAVDAGGELTIYKAPTPKAMPWDNPKRKAPPAAKQPAGKRKSR